MRKNRKQAQQSPLGLVHSPTTIKGNPPFTSRRERELEKALERLHLIAISRDALVTADMIVKALRGRSKQVRNWIKRNLVPVAHPTGRNLYIWGDVLQALRGGA